MGQRMMQTSLRSSNSQLWLQTWSCLWLVCVLKRKRTAREVVLAVLDGEESGGAEHGDAGGQGGELDCGRHYVGMI